MAEELEDRYDDIDEESSDVEEADRQPEIDWDKVDLDEIPNFRKYKSVKDKEIAAARREKEENERRARQYEQEMYRLRQQHFATLSDDEQKDALLSEAQREISRLREELDLSYAAVRREQQIAKLQGKTGVPEEILAEAENPNDAYERVIDFLLQSQKGKSMDTREDYGSPRPGADEPKRRKASDVDTGRGSDRSLSAKDKWAQEYQKIRQSGEVVQLIAHYKNRPQ